MSDSARRSGLLRANVAVALGTATSRLTGLLRLTALAYAVGVNPLANAYNRANSTPNILYELILGGILAATLVPVFTRAFDRDDDDAVSAVVSVAALVLGVLTVVATLAAPWIIAAYTPAGTGEDEREASTLLAYLFLPQILFYGLMAIGSAVLNARRHFFAPAWAPVLNNLVVIASLIAFAAWFGFGVTPEEALDDRKALWLLGVGTTAGIATMALVLVPALRRAGVHLRFRPEWRHPSVLEVLRLSGWTIGYVAANQVALLVVYRLAGSGLSSYQYAFIFFQLPHGLLAVSLMTTFAPDLASAWGRDDRQAYAERAALGLRLTALLVLPAGIGMAILARPIVGLLQRGSFDAEAAAGTATVLAAFALGLFGFSSYLFVLRCFYAVGDTRTPFLVNLVENGLNIALAVPLVDQWGTSGLAAAFAVAYLVSAGLALGVLARRVPELALPPLLLALARVGLAAAAMAAAVGLVAVVLDGREGWGALVEVAAGTAVGVVVYGLALVVLRVPDMAELRRRLARRRPITAPSP